MDYGIPAFIAVSIKVSNEKDEQHYLFEKHFIDNDDMLPLRMKKFENKTVHRVSKIPIEERWLCSTGRCQSGFTIYAKDFHKAYAHLSDAEKYYYVREQNNDVHDNGIIEEEDEDEDEQADRRSDDDEVAAAGNTEPELPVMTAKERKRLRFDNTRFRMQKVAAIWRCFTEKKRRAYAVVAQKMNKLPLSGMLRTIPKFLSKMYVGGIKELIKNCLYEDFCYVSSKMLRNLREGPHPGNDENPTKEDREVPFGHEAVVVGTHIRMNEFFFHLC